MCSKKRLPTLSETPIFDYGLEVAVVFEYKKDYEGLNCCVCLVL